MDFFKRGRIHVHRILWCIKRPWLGKNARSLQIKFTFVKQIWTLLTHLQLLIGRNKACEGNAIERLARVIAATSDPGVERLKLAGQKWAGKEVLSGNKILTRRKLSLTKYLLSLQIVQILNWRSVARPRRSRRHFENLSCFREDAWNTSKEENYKNIPETTIRLSQ